MVWLADLGVSSPQLDQAERGFSFMKDGLLDMRMDNSKVRLQRSGWSILKEEGVSHGIFNMVKSVIAAVLPKPLNRRVIETTAQLAEIQKVAHPKWKNKHAATRTFQAIRIAINKELEDIEKFSHRKRLRC